MAGLVESQGPQQHQKKEKERAIAAVNAILEQWEVQYARFVLYPPLSSLSGGAAAAIHHHPSIGPHSAIKRKFSRGLWISTSSSSNSSSSASAYTSSSATLKLIADCSVGSDDAVLNVSLRGKVLEEHYISKLHFSWPHVSCVSGFPARGTRYVFLSYKDSLGQIQKFALRFMTVQETEKLIHLLQKILEDLEPEDLPRAEHISKPSAKSEFVPSTKFPQRAEEGCRSTVLADNCENQTPATQNKDVVQLHTTHDAMPNSQAEETLSDFPPSFASFLMNCCPAVGKEKSKGHEEADLKFLIERYLQDSSFQDTVTKVEKVINELGYNVVL